MTLASCSVHGSTQLAGDDISLGIECPITDDPPVPTEIAGELDRLNRGT